MDDVHADLRDAGVSRIAVAARNFNPVVHAAYLLMILLNAVLHGATSVMISLKPVVHAAYGVDDLAQAPRPA